MTAAKNIVIYSDGTGQDGGVRPEQRVSNVYKMYRASRVAPETAIDPREQVTFYDPGLGTDIGATALTALCASSRNFSLRSPDAGSQRTSPTATNSSSTITSVAIGFS
jgi:uncharacterized protein (DUF2235 family)